MAQWGNNDAANNSVLWAPTSVKLAPNTSNRDALFGNTTANAFITGVTVGQYGVDANEVAAGGGKVSHTGWVLQTTGSGGRSGRVMTEVLVAGGIASDGSDDAVLPDYSLRITTQPVGNTANTFAGENATFRVVGASTPAGATLSYQWTYANGDAIATNANVGVTTAANLVINSAVQSTNASFKVTIYATGAANVVSSNAVLTIQPAQYVLGFTAQPANTSANSTNNDIATFTGAAATTPSGGSVGYKWQYYNGAIFLDLSDAGAYSNTSTATLSVLANAASNGEVFRLSATNPGAVTVYSSNATLTITT